MFVFFLFFNLLHKKKLPVEACHRQITTALRGSISSAKNTENFIISLRKPSSRCRFPQNCFYESINTKNDFKPLKTYKFNASNVLNSNFAKTAYSKRSKSCRYGVLLKSKRNSWNRTDRNVKRHSFRIFSFSTYFSNCCSTLRNDKNIRQRKINRINSNHSLCM